MLLDYCGKQAKVPAYQLPGGPARNKVRDLTLFDERTRATGERLVASYNCRELVELGSADIIQTDINHVGGITGLWKTAALTDASGAKMASHACEGPIGGMATIHADAAMPTFLIQEICSGVEPGGKEKIWADWFGFPAMRMVNGKFPLPTRPMARAFHKDGSVTAW